MRDSKRGTIEDRRTDRLFDRRPLGKLAGPAPKDFEGALERLLERLANAKNITDVNIAAGITRQELSNDGA